MLTDSTIEAYNGYTITIWASAEPAATIIACSIPVMRVLFKHKAKVEPKSDRLEQSSQSEPSKTIESVLSSQEISSVSAYRDWLFYVPADKKEEISMTWFDSSNEANEQ